MKEERQESYISRLEYLLSSIHTARYSTGKDPINKEDIDKEILEVSNKLDNKHYEIFENMLN